MSNLFTPLTGVRVLDLSRYFPGPFLTRTLVDLGAEVIKVEPLTGEGLRWMPPRINKMGAAFSAFNADKDSLAIDFKKPEGVELVKALAAACDIVVEAFRPGKMAALGLGPDDLHSVNPRLIICSLSGFGQTGPMAQVAGHDINYIAHAGLLSITGPHDGPPGVPGVQIADAGGGSLPAAIGILAALIEREKTGKGRYLDISLTRGAVAFGSVTFAGVGAGYLEPRGNGMLTGGAPCYRCYRTKDDRFMALGALEPHFFAGFCQLIERPDLAKLGYAQGKEAQKVIAELETIFASRTQAEWTALCADKDVCVTAVRSPQEAMDDPEFSSVVRHAGPNNEVPVFSTHVGAPTKAPERPPSILGADAKAVVERLKIDTDLVQSAIEQGAFTWPEDNA